MQGLSVKRNVECVLVNSGQGLLKEILNKVLLTFERKVYTCNGPFSCACFKFWQNSFMGRILSLYFSLAVAYYKQNNILVRRYKRRKSLTCLYLVNIEVL